VWAVGRYQGQALAEQWNGSFWNAIPTQPVIIGGNGLWDVDAASSSQVWSVGEALDDDEESKTLIQRWDGAAWSVVASPNGGIATSDNYLRGVEVVAANDVWAVGYYNDGGANADRTLILRWDGAAWNVVSSSNVGADDNRLFAVTAVAANDVWAVGYYTSSGVAQTLVLRWNGSAWSVVNSPNSGPGNNNLYGVTAVSANDVWAVGRFVVGGVSQSLVERWNGSTWNIVTSPNVGAGPNLLTDVSAASANDVWAVGNYDNGNNHTLTMRWDGSTWNVVTSPDAGPGDSYPQGVVAVSPTEAWMVGYYENGTSTQTLVERWNGSSWNVVTSPNPSMSNNLLTRVTTVPGGATDVWAVGYYEGAQIYQTLVERYNPCDCSIGFTDVPEGSTFYDFVVCMACQGIISGYTTGCETGDPCFRPNNNVTRGQLSKIVANAAGFSEPVGAQQYEDVPPGSTFFDFVWRLSDRGIVGGYACGGPGEPCVAPGNLPYFRPNGNATRGQISKIVANAANLSDPPGNQIFEDVPPGSTFFDFVQRLTNLGVMGGYACGGPGEPCVPPGNLAYFRPQNNATRGQTSKVVANSFFPNCDTIAAQKRK
jgi:hypothetical protein